MRNAIEYSMPEIPAKKTCLANDSNLGVHDAVDLAVQQQVQVEHVELVNVARVLADAQGKQLKSWGWMALG